MDINYFKEFSVLAETKNYWEAAERLYINQSTLSKHIKAMEQELGVPLFARTTRKVELTEFGTAFLPYAQSIVRTQFDYSAMLLQKKNHNKSQLAIGSIPVMAQYRITTILLDFQKLFPNCGFQIIEDDAKNLRNLLLSRKCELIFLREQKHPGTETFETDDKIIHIPYMTDYLVALLPKEHPLADRKELTLRSLQGEKFCFLKETSLIYDLSRSACQEAGFIPDIVFDSHRLDSIFDMVTYGGCVALLMNQHMHNLCDAGPSMPFAMVKVSPTISTQISLCCLKDAPLSKMAEEFIRYFQSFCAAAANPD
ncbi:MAG: LysR family transcriptional regulator [Candidatus Limivivens sp.]|nr:LysR family transcriptional regulator [Candidatus Limivivens sp.]